MLDKIWKYLSKDGGFKSWMTKYTIFYIISFSITYQFIDNAWLKTGLSISIASLSFIIIDQIGKMNERRLFKNEFNKRLEIYLDILSRKVDLSELNMDELRLSIRSQIRGELYLFSHNNMSLSAWDKDFTMYDVTDGEYNDYLKMLRREERLKKLLD